MTVRSCARSLRDRNLWLALLDETRRRSHGYSWLPTVKTAYEDARDQHPDWRPWAVIEESEELNPELEEFLLSLTVDPDQLARLQRLTLDGDRDLYAWIFHSWWDFGDHFAIHDLSGIELCQGLEYLLLGQGVVQGCSLRPLVGLGQLQELHLCAMGSFADIECLVEIAALRRLEVVNAASSPQREQWEAIQAQVRQRTASTGSC